MATPVPLQPVPSVASFLTFDLRHGAKAKDALQRVAKAFPTRSGVLGVGLPLALALRSKVRGLRAFPAIAGPGVSFPSTQGALWMMLGGKDTSHVFDDVKAIRAVADAAFVLRDETHAFKYQGGRDLTGYEDGTENPKGTKARDASMIRGQGAGYDGGSFVAVQRYVHDLEGFATLSQKERDFTIGRHHKTNEELAGAPESAHVKRSAQESFAPEAFMVRRSMPWGNSERRGLYFVAFGATLDAYERVLTRMAGLDDGVVDGLLRMTHAETGGYYFCPPVLKGNIVLGACLG